MSYYWVGSGEDDTVELHVGDVIHKLPRSTAIRLGHRLLEMAEATEIHTLVECSAPDCKLGVRNQYAVLGMCVTCAEGEIERLRGIERVVMLTFENREAAIRHYRYEASKCGGPGNNGAIADALEAK